MGCRECHEGAEAGTAPSVLCTQAQRGVPGRGPACWQTVPREEGGSRCNQSGRTCSRRRCRASRRGGSGSRGGSSRGGIRPSTADQCQGSETQPKCALYVSSG